MLLSVGRLPLVGWCGLFYFFLKFVLKTVTYVRTTLLCVLSLSLSLSSIYLYIHIYRWNNGTRVAFINNNTIANVLYLLGYRPFILSLSIFVEYIYLPYEYYFCLQEKKKPRSYTNIHTNSFCLY